MGAWGKGPFENDDACDWLAELTDSDWSAIDEALAPAGTADYLEAPEGSRIIAAAEVVAAAQNAPAADLPEEMTAWLAEHEGGPGPARSRSAIAAVERVLAERSELAELWEGNGGWREQVNDLLSRLRS